MWTVDETVLCPTAGSSAVAAVAVPRRVVADFIWASLTASVASVAIRLRVSLSVALVL